MKNNKGMNEEKTTQPNQLQETEEKIKQWRQANPDATLTEIELAIDEELRKVRQLLVEKTAQELNKETDENKPVHCPQCDRPMMRNGKKRRRLRTKGGEKIELEREQMRCHQCGMTLFPPG
jgi:RNase P subunit RPR2